MKSSCYVFSRAISYFVLLKAEYWNLKKKEEKKKIDAKE